MRVIGFDSLVLARLGRNYLFTSAELKRLLHISYRDLRTILFLKLEHTVGDSCLLKWRKCAFWYILLFLCQLEPFTPRVILVSTMFRLISTCSFFFSFWKLIIKYAGLLVKRKKDDTVIDRTNNAYRTLDIAIYSDCSGECLVIKMNAVRWDGRTKHCMLEFKS